MSYARAHVRQVGMPSFAHCDPAGVVPAAVTTRGTATRVPFGYRIAESEPENSRCPL